MTEDAYSICLGWHASHIDSEPPEVIENIEADLEMCELMMCRESWEWPAT